MQDYETSDLLGLIAVVGMAVRVPGANNLQEFWENLCRGVDSITHFTDEELLGAGISRKLLDDPDYVKANGTLPDIEMFDAEFFGINKREAEITDPQHRIFLECAWEALESAGYNPFTFDGRIGVFSSESLNSYFIQNLYTNRELLEAVGGNQMILGNDRDFLATRLSFLLNLRGPSIVLQSACSSSLSAVHLACQSLNGGESDMALAGGISISLPQNAGYLYQVGGIYSADGRCRAFDEKATGTIGGNGVGLVVLKRLEDALQDGDYVYSVIRGSAINNDGNAKVGYTAPSVQGQAEVIEEALAVARIDASTVGYVEAHGTGTPLGDPIEVEALIKAFSISPGEKQSCAVGSVKTNLGHLDAAAGVVGLIKTSLMLKHGELVPSLHFETPNPKINFAQSPFYINIAHHKWETVGLRRAGVSSFGIGGTNVHVVLEEFRENKKRETETPEKLLIFSAKNNAALHDLHEKTAAFLETNENVVLDDAAFTLQTGRRHFNTRAAIVCRDRQEAVARLKNLAARDSSGNLIPEGSAPEIAFLFPGQGTQYPAMAKDVYQSEDLFRELFDRCATAFQDEIETDLRRVLYSDDENAVARINQTAITQPLMFSVEFALAGLLKSWGITPSAMIGHSLGEYTAACVAGVFSFEDAVKIVARRARLMQKLPAGSMLSVKTAPEKIEELLDAKLAIAVLNAPDLCVVSGASGEIERLQSRLEKQRIGCQLLKTSHAFHSPMMNDVLEPFHKELSAIKLNPPQIPFISNLTGNWIKDAEAVNPEYWVKHLRQTVRFSDGVRRLAQNERLIFIEAGPRSLSILAQMQTSAQTIAALPATGENVSSLRTVIELVGNLWTAGYEVDWRKFNAPAPRGRRVPLPTYPFRREYFWVNPTGAGGRKNVEAAAKPENPAKPMLTDAPPASENRHTTVWKILREIIFDLTGSRVGDIDPETTFYQLGVDSLLLIQASQEIGKRLGIKISFQQMLEEYPTLNALADFLSENLPEQPTDFSVEEPLVELLPPSSSVSSVASREPEIRKAEIVISAAIAQLQQSLASLRNGKSAEKPLKTEPAAGNFASSHDGGGEEPETLSDVPRFVPFKPIKIDNNSELTQHQKSHLNQLIERYTRKTAESKRLIQESRSVHADSRHSLNFRRVWKEMVYPLIGDKSKGSQIWDVDGNRYLDLTMSFGVGLFGHAPDFIRTAISEQIEKGLHLGPQTKLAGEVSELFSALTGEERVAYTVSGTEAVMIAMRLARTVTGRDKIVCFSGSYHGSSDAVLARQSNEKGQIQAVPLAPGITKQAVADTFVLEYDDPQSLLVILENADDIAAVIVEAVQSRRPDLQPRTFLEELRKITAQKGIVLIFDEIITGFRLHPRGAQGWFGVKADLATYGKVIGGGLPVGAIAGKSEILNAIDGGIWKFGNDSYPAEKQTYVAGTFYKHPLGMAAMRAILRHLLKEGGALQETLNSMTSSIVGRLNAFLRDENLPIKVVQCGSLFRFNIPRGVFLGDLFFYHLIEKGVYIWEGRNCFLSTAHTAEDLEFLFNAVRETVFELKSNDFLTETIFDGKTSENVSQAALNSAQNAKIPAAGENEDRFPLTEGQQQIWLACRLSDEASAAYNESVLLKFKGRLDAEALTEAFDRLVARHEALHTVFSPQGDYQKVLRTVKIGITRHDLSSFAAEEKKSAFKNLIESEARAPFNLVDGPLVRAVLIKEEENLWILCLTIHHLVVDGWSFGILLNELKELYAATVERREPLLAPPPSYRGFTEKQIFTENDAATEAENFWLGEFSDAAPVAALPADFTRPESAIFSDDEVTLELGGEYLEALKNINDRTTGTMFVSLLTVCSLALSYVSQKNDFIIGIHSAGQLSAGERDLVGYYVNLLPLRAKINVESNFAAQLNVLKTKLFEIYEHQSYPLGKLIRKLNPPRVKGRSPLIAVTFNSFRAYEKESFSGLTMETQNNPSGYSRFDLNFNLLEWDDRLEWQAIYNKDIFAPETVRSWLGLMSKILLLAGENIEISIHEITAALADYEAELKKSRQREFKENRLASLRKFTRKNT